MSKDLYIQRLRAVPLFSTLAKRELDMIVRQADHLRYPARYRVVREGTPGEEFWMVIDGELAVIDPAPRDASVVATTPVELMVIGRRRFWTTVEASPSLMRKLMIGLARRLHEADRREIDLRKANSLTDA